MTDFKKKEIETKSGKKYVLQHPGVRNVSKINDRIKNKNGILSEEKLCDEMFKHVVVDPKLTIDNFEEYGEMIEVANRAYLFITDTPDPEESEESSDADN
ncbi:hypothetical protein D3C75_801220 [compost metagenome]